MTNEQIDALAELPSGSTKDPDVIYLEQECCADECYGRRWTKDADCFDGCADGVAPTKYIRADIVRELCETVKLLRGTIAADDERLRIAGERTGLPFGCDTAEHMADELLVLREEVKRLRAALAEAEAKPSTEEIIEACGGDWVLEEWDEEHPEDFVLEVMRAMRDEQQRWRKEAKRLQAALRSVQQAVEMQGRNEPACVRIAALVTEALR